MRIWRLKTRRIQTSFIAEPCLHYSELTKLQTSVHDSAMWVERSGNVRSQPLALDMFPADCMIMLKIFM